MSQSIASSFAGLCCVYDDPTWLAQMISSVYSQVGALYFLVSDRPWNSERVDNTRTISIIREFPDPDRKIHFIPGDWTNETDQRNAGLALMAQAGFQYCFIVDADELYDPVDLTRMQTAVLSRTDVGCWYMSWFTYWKSEEFRIDPPEQYTPAVFLRLDCARFRENRHVIAPMHGVLSPQIGMCHHMSYARSDEEILRKIRTFSHAQEIRPEWFEKVWLRWNSDHGLENLHPVYPAAYRRAIPQPKSMLPPVLRGGGHLRVV